MDKVTHSNAIVLASDFYVLVSNFSKIVKVSMGILLRGVLACYRY